MEIGHLWLVGGGNLASIFMDKSLITNISIVQMPIVLGSGIKLFGPLIKSNLIKLENYQVSEFGFVQTNYKIKKT